MNKINILIFENEIPAVSIAFNDINNLDFDGSLNFEFKSKSQSLKDNKTLKNYDIIFVDIDLSANSEKDGYGIIEELKINNYENIVVLTGNMVKEELKNRGWSDIKILSKPIFLDELTDIINSFKK